MATGIGIWWRRIGRGPCRAAPALLIVLAVASAEAATVRMRNGREITEVERVERFEARGQMKVVKRDGFVLYVELAQVLEVLPDEQDRRESTPPAGAAPPAELEPPKGLVENLEEFRRLHPEYTGGEFSAEAADAAAAAAAGSGATAAGDPGEENYWRARAQQALGAVENLESQIQQLTEEYNQVARQHNSSADPVQRSILRGQLNSISDQRREAESGLRQAQADQRQLRLDAESAGVPLEWVLPPSEPPPEEPPPEEPPPEEPP